MWTSLGSHGQSSFKSDWSEMESSFVVRQNKAWNLLLKIWTAVLRTKELRDNPACSKAWISVILEVHQCLWNWKLTHLKRSHQSWTVETNFKATYAPIFLRECLARTHILHLLQQHSFKVEESGYWTDLAPVQTLRQLKTFGVSWNQEVRSLYQTRREKHSSPKSPEAGLHRSQMFMGYC